MPDHSFRKEIFPNIQSTPLLVQLETISSHPVTSYLGEETNTRLATTSFQVVVESDKVSPSASSRLNNPIPSAGPHKTCSVDPQKKALDGIFLFSIEIPFNRLRIKFAYYLKHQNSLTL